MTKVDSRDVIEDKEYSVNLMITNTNFRYFGSLDREVRSLLEETLRSIRIYRLPKYTHTAPEGLPDSSQKGTY